MTGPRVTREALQAAASAGFGQMAVARDLGVSRAAVNRAVAREGIKLPRPAPHSGLYQRDHRDVVQDMKPLEAVDYLLAVIDNLRPPMVAEWVWPGARLTRQERQLVFALARSGARVLTRAAAVDAIMHGRGGDDAPAQKIIDVILCRLRKKLAHEPLRFVTHWGTGWTVEAPDGFIWPWEQQA